MGLNDKDYKQTDWDSSFATLKRIDGLVQSAHKIKINGPDIGNNYVPAYQRVIDRIYVEGRAKFSKTEKETCEKHRQLIHDLKIKWGVNLTLPKIGESYYKKDNPQYNSGWFEIETAIEGYEIDLMEYMDKHNMLLRDAKDAIRKFKEG